MGNWVNTWRETIKTLYQTNAMIWHESKEVHLIVVIYHASDFNFPGVLRFAKSQLTSKVFSECGGNDHCFQFIKTGQSTVKSTACKKVLFKNNLSLHLSLWSFYSHPWDIEFTIFSGILIHFLDYVSFSHSSQ